MSNNLGYTHKMIELFWIAEDVSVWEQHFVVERIMKLSYWRERWDQQYEWESKKLSVWEQVVF